MKQLEKGNRVGIIAPAWIPIHERLEKGIRYLQAKGLTVTLSANLRKKHSYFAGTDEERIADIHDMFADRTIDAVICARGGWGTLRLIDQLDYQLISSNPKPFIGYSDITTLQLAMWKKCTLHTFSGPMAAVEMGKGIDSFTERHFWNLVQNRKPEYKIDLADSDANIMNPGQANGPLLGGCLAMISTLLGTEYSPDYSGSILFIEDVGEKPYKIDRYLAHLKQAGIFNSINGLIIGQFIECEPDKDEDSFSINDLIHQYFSNLECPVISNFPYGHGDIKYTMPVGSDTFIDTETQSIRFTNPFFEYSS